MAVSWVPLFDALVQGEPPHPGNKILSLKLALGAAQCEDFVILGCTVFDRAQGCDRHIDRWTDARAMAKTHEA